MARQEAKSRAIVITGATDGLGLELARAYASRGHRVIATGRQLLTNDLDFFGTPNIAYIRADQSEPEASARAIEQAMTKFGWDKIDLAILNAATGWTGHPADEMPDQIRTQIAVNLTATVLISKALAPLLFAAQGQLVLIGSTAVKGQAQFATYAATKAGLEGFARSLREEWRTRAHVQIIHPGPTRTKMHAKAGLKTGVVRMFFMSTKRAVRAIQKSIRNKDKKRTLSRSYGWSSLFSSAKEGEL